MTQEQYQGWSKFIVELFREHCKDEWSKVPYSVREMGFEDTINVLTDLAMGWFEEQDNVAINLSVEQEHRLWQYVHARLYRHFRMFA